MDDFFDTSNETVEFEGQDSGIWLAIGDLMSGLLMFIALLFITVQVQLQDKREQVDRLETELQDKISELQKYQDAFDRLPIAVLDAIEQGVGDGDAISVDPATGDVSIRDRILFDEGSAELKPQGKQFLQQFVPLYARVIFSNEQFEQQIARVVVEGHTSSKGSERNNMKLSLQRALSVADYIFSDELQFRAKDRFKQKLLASGRGEIDAKRQTDDPQDRKVVFRFQFRRQNLKQLFGNEPSATAPP
jgi:outer membrane protein OmpA-like peptidoglycan-associated protein